MDPALLFACACHALARRLVWMRDRLVIDHLTPWPTAISLREIAAGTGLSLVETRQAVASLVAKGVLVVHPGGPSSEPLYALNLVRRPMLLRVDQ